MGFVYLVPNALISSSAQLAESETYVYTTLHSVCISDSRIEDGTVGTSFALYDF